MHTLLYAASPAWRFPGLPTMLLLAALFCLCSTSRGETKPESEESLLTAGRQLVAQLKFDAQADAKIFTEIGLERAQKLLSAVTSYGLKPDATPEDWASLHRAFDGLIELHEQKGELVKASTFASFQNMCFRNFEHDYAAALKASQKALELQQRSGVLEAIDIPMASIGRDHLALGNTAEALKHFLEARKHIAKTEEKRAAHNWRDIILAHLGLKQMADARRESERFVQASRAASAMFQAEAYIAQSDVCMEEGRFDDALLAIKLARASIEGDPDASTFEYEVASQLLSCVLASMNALSYDEALALAKRLDGEFTGLPFNIAPFARLSISLRRRMAGEMDGVLREQTAELEREKAAGNVGAQAEILRRIAASYRTMNSVRNQIAALEQSLALEKSMLAPSGLPLNAANAYAYFRVLNSLGEAYVRAGSSAPGKAGGNNDKDWLVKAQACFDEVTAKIVAVPDAASKKGSAKAFGEAILGKARLAELAFQPDRARELLAKALAPDPLGQGTYVREDVLLQSARLERDLRENPLMAAANYAEAIALFSGKNDRQSEVITRLEYAHFLTAQAAKIPDAMNLAAHELGTAATLASALQLAEAQWRVDYEKGSVARLQGQSDVAMECYKKAVAGLEKLRAGVSQSAQRQELLDRDTVQDLYRQLTALLVASGDQAGAWQYVESSKARSFLEMLQGRRFHARQDSAAARELASLEAQMINLRVQLSPETAALRSAGRATLLNNELRDMESKFTLARQQAELGSTRAGQVLASRPLPLAELQKLLSPKTALLEYALLADGVAGFVIARHGTALRHSKLNPAALGKNVLELCSLLASRESPDDEVQRLVAKVSAALIAPLIADLPAEIDRLIIVPTGQLNYLPFQVLALPDGRPLVERFTISYLPSASALSFLKGGATHGDDVFLGALGEQAVDGLPPLPGTVREIEAIGQIYPKARRLSAKALTHDAVTAALSKHAIVHLATHGLLDEDAPLFSALLTSPCAGQPSQVSLYEIADLDLKAGLVVLSACETGKGRMLGGDEVVGLTRTFLTAGADTVVSSLWKVSDTTTAELMQQFYSRLKAGTPVAQAMREASLEIRKQHPHPYDWAPFIVTGAP